MSGKCCKNTLDDDKQSQDSEVELVSPEKGFAYVICFAFAIMYFTILGPTSSFGFIYSQFFDDIGQGTSGITLVTGIGNAVVSCAGFLTSSVLKRFTNRQVGIIGALFYILGSFLTVFVTSITHLIVTFAFLQAIGFGMMIPISLASFNEYFVERRVAMMSVASLLISLGCFAYPEALRVSMEQYGFRGTLLILAALSCHTLVAMAIMQPVEMHLVPKKKTSIPELTVEFCEGKEKFENNNTQKIYELQEVTEKKNFQKEDRDSSRGYEPLLPEALMPTLLKSEHNKSVLESNERSLALTYNALHRGEYDGIVDEGYRSNLAKAGSLASLGNWTGNVIASEAAPKRPGKLQPIVEYLDLTLLKDPVYANICFGISFTFFSDITFFLLEPILLKSYGFSMSEIAMCITAGAAADMVSRLLLTIVNFYITVKSRHVVYAGTWLMIIFRTAFLQSTGFWHVVTFTACLGFVRSWLQVPLPLVFAEYCSPDRFPSAYGLFMLISGLIMLSLGPLVGLLRDLTNSYFLAFHSLNVLCLLCVLPWSIEMYFSYRNRTRKM